MTVDERSDGRAPPQTFNQAMREARSSYKDRLPFSVIEPYSTEVFSDYTKELIREVTESEDKEESSQHELSDGGNLDISASELHYASRTFTLHPSYNSATMVGHVIAFGRHLGVAARVDWFYTLLTITVPVNPQSYHLAVYANSLENTILRHCHKSREEGLDLVSPIDLSSGVNPSFAASAAAQSIHNFQHLSHKQGTITDERLNMTHAKISHGSFEKWLERAHHLVVRKRGQPDESTGKTFSEMTLSERMEKNNYTRKRRLERSADRERDREAFRQRASDPVYIQRLMQRYAAGDEIDRLSTREDREKQLHNTVVGGKIHKDTEKTEYKENEGQGARIY